MIAAAVLVTVPAGAQSGQLQMLDQLLKGAWELKTRDSGAHRRICVRDGREFIQLQAEHRQPVCSRFVVRDEADMVAIQYTCRNHGYGRTSIRRESNGLVQVESRGIVNGAPFTVHGEARHTGGRC